MVLSVTDWRYSRSNTGSARSGGFPESIRDCRNAIRFIRKNAERFHIDPERIEVTGGSGRRALEPDGGHGAGRFS